MGELPDPEPDPEAVAPKVERDARGRVVAGASAAALARRGGQMQARRAGLRVALAALLPGDMVPDDAPMAEAIRHAEQFRDVHLTTLAASAGGICGPGPASMVASAALQLAASRYLFGQGARTGDAFILKTASGLANDSRQNLLAAYELAVREARARTDAQGPADPLARFVTP